MREFRAGEREHPLGHVDARDLGSAARGEMVRELPAAAAQIEHAPPPDVRQQSEQLRMLHRPVPSRPEPLQRGVAGEKLRVIINILRLTNIPRLT